MIGGKFGQKKEMAVAGLLLKDSLPAAAEHAGISTNTLLRYLQDEDFQALYRQAKKEALRQAVSQLQSAAGEAVQVLRDVARDDTVSPSARVAAARTILDGAIKITELQDLEERLTELEKQQKEAI